MTTVRTVVHDRRIEVAAPDDLADGTEVILAIGTDVARGGHPRAGGYGALATAGDSQRRGGGP